jgi:hypothetical protein
MVAVEADVSTAGILKKKRKKEEIGGGTGENSYRLV